MYVRLAFAVAAHLEPEILIVDEVLAVGDAQFQKKCLGKMEDVTRQGGKTVLFVSHNLRAIEQLCNKSILMVNGNISCIDRTSKVIEHYIVQNQEQLFCWERKLSGVNNQYRNFSSVFFSKIWLEQDIKHQISVPRINTGEPFIVCLEAINQGYSNSISIAFCIKSMKGEIIFTSHHHDKLDFLPTVAGDIITTNCAVDPNILLPGSYVIDIGITDPSWKTIDYIEDAIGFEIVDESQKMTILDKRPGIIFLPLEWEIKIMK
jgi:lipopolysaccharide transport system ATP-binding protein